MDGLQFDADPFNQDSFNAAEGGASRGQSTDALFAAMVFAVVDRGADGFLKFAFEQFAYQEDVVLRVWSKRYILPCVWRAPHL